MKQSTLLLAILGVSILALTTRGLGVNAQIFDQLMRSSTNRNSPVEAQNQENGGSRFGNVFKDMMSVNVPVFYDMIKEGSSLGINVLSGLVKVERGKEAERSGLVGPRPLSVRVFGVPVYERGVRIRNPPESRPGPADSGEPKVNIPAGSEEEELPVYN